MKREIRFCRRVACGAAWLMGFLLLCPSAMWAAEQDLSSRSALLSHLVFKQVASDVLPSAEVQKVYQDREGFVWMATRYGLCKYDGYQGIAYKSNLYTPGLLTNNNIYCFTDDYERRLWIGTQEGLNVFNKKTGEIKRYKAPDIPNNVVSCLLTARDSSVWIGTDYGLCRYRTGTDTLVTYRGVPGAEVLEWAAVKSLFEDADGEVWIGTWANGLFRYSPKTDRFYAYPPLNEQNSAHFIYQDSEGDIWVGGWDSGLFRLHHPKEMDKVSFTRYGHSVGDDTTLADNIVYDMVEDLHTHSLWVGTRAGLSIMERDTPGRFINYKPRHSPFRIPCDEVNSLLRDRAGNIWLGTIGGGVMLVDTKRSPFAAHPLEVAENDVPATAIRALFADAEGNLWLGAGGYGLACRDARSGETRFYTRIPEFAGVSGMPTVNDMVQRANGELWIGTYDGGIMVYRKGERVRVLLDTPYLYSSCVTALHEDRRQNCWVGCRGGMGVCLADGSGYKLGILSFEDGGMTDWFHVKDMAEDKDGTLWVATANCGIIRIRGDVRRPETLRFANYSFDNGRLAVNSVLCFYLDTHGRLWAGTEGGGVYLYDRENDAFCCKNGEYNIPGDMVVSMEEDSRGYLWMGTNAGLVRLEPAADGVSASTRVFTTADGLTGNSFTTHSACRIGDRLFFGGTKGYNSFLPTDLEENDSDVNYYITDIKLFNRSLSSLEPAVRQKISALMPPYTEKIVLPYDYNNFSIEFASLTYKYPELNRYAYRLKGFDEEWQYTDAAHRFAYYNNLGSGTYRFLLRATNENGRWSPEVRELVIVVRPPFWATWWAYLAYFFVGMTGIWVVWHVARNRMLLRNELRMRAMEQSKTEEINHAKLQFFTNITHELLTPLTIISASVDDLKQRLPGQDELYAVMTNNIRRLIRLLQQILEFRKAETGNLKLRVSPGDVAAFVKNEVESFRPLTKQRKLHFSLLCTPDSISGYFDIDKLDKILYNLLSNAAKYNKEGGYIQVTLAYAANRDYIELRVKDNGKGISKEKQKTLFSRFYEGDYRKFGAIGTGIGLSLTKELVELHGGKIEIESEEDKGAEFKVTLPIDRSYFSEEQIDEEATLPVQTTVSFQEGETEETAVRKKTKTHSLLVVEDKEELLQLMVRLLQREYNVHTAENGQEAIAVIENEDIDLVVSDVMMPVMDGIEFCKYVKNKLELSHIPVILLTAKSAEEDRAEAYEVGADAFISKPFNLAVLYARIRNLLKAKERMARDFKNQLVFEVKDMDYTSLDEEFIQRAIECVNRHLEDCDFDQAQFVEEMGTSKSTLYKKLKSLTGLNTSAFIRNIRLKAACRIMEEKKNSVRISELAYAVGFNDPKYFSACFKKEFGMLPTEYLEQFTS